MRVRLRCPPDMLDVVMSRCARMPPVPFCRPKHTYHAQMLPLPRPPRRESAFKCNHGADEQRLLLVDGAEELALEQHLLGHLGAKVGVRRLLVDEHATKLAQLRVDGGDLQLERARTDVELLVVLGEERLVAARLQRRERDGLIVAGGGAAALGVEEEAGAVRRHDELARELEARVDGRRRLRRRRDQVLDGEEERHALAARQLHGRRRIVNAVLLDELELARVGDQVALDAGEDVRLARRHLRVDRLSGQTRLGQLLLEHLERRGLKAELVDLVLLARAERQLGRAASLDLGARVGEASALDLLVRQRADLAARERASARTLHARANRKRSSKARGLPVGALGHLR
mmetsp:Transcript_13416/g.35183  ORF Transcript_13416/g.35183 Transcript_13416/m.35183 type:complete len:347 (+) Transcript_13416:201-1241(+)